MRRTAAVGLVLVLVGLASPVAADAPDEAGWWWKVRSASLPLSAPAPPSIPEDGLYVAADPSGPTAIAGVRARLDLEARPTTLTVAVADVQGTPVVGACPTTDAWEAVEGGTWEDRPMPDCGAGNSAGTYDAAAKTIAFPVAALVRDGVLDVLLVPGQGSAFSLSLKPPGGDSLVLESAPPSTTTTTAAAVGTDEPAPPPPSEASPPSESLPAPVPEPSFDAPSPVVEASPAPFEPPPATSDAGSTALPAPFIPPAAEVPVAVPSAPSAAGAAPAGTSTDVGVAPAGDELAVAPVAAAPTPLDRRRGVLAGGLLLLGVAGVGLALQPGPTGQPRLAFLAPRPPALAGVPTGGIGRFARPRDGRPPRFR